MFFKKSGNSCRERTSHLQSLSINHILWALSLLFRAFLTILAPAGCSSIIAPEQNPPVVISKAPLHQPEPSAGNTCLDILIFEDDRLGRLDAYQRISEFDSDIAYVESTGGKKIIFFCTSGPYYRHEWRRINSYSALYQMRAELRHESREFLTRTAECRTTAGDRYGTAVLKPLTCKIQIDAISYDFSGTPYSNSHITDLKAYLINVNSSCPLTCSSPEKPVQIINHGRLSPEDINSMTEPDLVYSHLTDKLEGGRMQPVSDFICMPNHGTEGNPGNPPTRLVLEGVIDGHTYYWPVNVGSDKGKGTYLAERGCCYAYDIHIRRKGTSDPDIPVSTSTGEIKLNVKSWIEKTEYGIEF